MRAVSPKTAATFLALSLLASAAGVRAQQPPPPAPTTFVFEESATLGPAQVMGDTPFGRRQSVPITGGTFSGPGISGQILPGGADYQLIRADGAVRIEADYMIETDDHVKIHVRNVGVIVPPADGRPAYAWAAPTIESPSGKYGWLNNAIFISRISPGGDKEHPAVKITIYKVG